MSRYNTTALPPPPPPLMATTRGQYEPNYPPPPPPRTRQFAGNQPGTSFRATAQPSGRAAFAPVGNPPSVAGTAARGRGGATRGGRGAATRGGRGGATRGGTRSATKPRSGRSRITPLPVTAEEEAEYLDYRGSIAPAPPISADKRAPTRSGTVISGRYTAGDAIVANLLKEAACDGVSEQDVLQFLNVVDSLQLTADQLSKAARSFAISNPNYFTGPGTAWRSGGGTFNPTTYGRAGSGEQDVAKPSLRWKIAHDNCQVLPELSQALISTFVDGNLGDYMRQIGGPSKTVAFTPLGEDTNAELANFLSYFNQCEGNVVDIMRLLNLIDTHKWKAADVTALMSVLNDEGYFEPAWSTRGNSGQYQYRSDDLQLVPVVKGTTLNTQNELKTTLLWDLLSRECQQLGPAVQELGRIIGEFLQPPSEQAVANVLGSAQQLRTSRGRSLA